MTARPTVTGQLTFTVTGDPVPQGSMRWLGARGMIAANKSKLEPWRESIRTAAHNAMPQPWRPLEGPLQAQLEFWIRAPKTRPRWRIYPDGRPDIDKLVRAAFDSLTSIGVWLDDAQVVTLIAHKRYPEPDNDDNETLGLLPIPGLVVRVRSIGAGDVQ